VEEKREERYHKRIEEKNSQETLLLNIPIHIKLTLDLFKSVSSKQKRKRIDNETT
jgi:Holliday junction resolvase RusA-like endonuclease